MTWQVCCISAPGTAIKTVPERPGTFSTPFLLIDPSFLTPGQEFGVETPHPLVQAGTANEITGFPYQNYLVEHKLICLSKVTC